MEELVEDALDAELEEELEEQITEEVARATEQNIQENIEENIEETVEQTVDASVEENVEEDIADAVEETVEEQVADAAESSVEETVEEQVADAAESSVEETVEEQVADAAESSVEETVEEQVADAAESSVEESVEDTLEAGVEDTLEGGIENRVLAVIEERLEYEIDEVVDALEGNLDVDEGRILTEHWLVMAEPLAFAELNDKGYLFGTITELPALGLQLAEVAAPSSFDITEVRDGVLDVVGKDRAEVDLNHIYTAGVPELASSEGLEPGFAMPFPDDTQELGLRIGMIDSGVDTTHPALSGARIHARSFASPGAASPSFHGTAIASIIAGNAEDYRGLAPGAEVYAASVFELDEKRGEVASTVSLIRALDWLIASDVQVVNVSLAGPPNRLLERALQRAADQQVIVMAAAGNGGPMARPMYPAAYDSVVAVTAVDAARQVFRLANRGDYLALAAPGVDLRHARPGGGYTASSGTSFAVPFAVTAAARLTRKQPDVDIIQMLLDSALDIGPPGRDQIYGYGLLTLGSL